MMEERLSGRRRALGLTAVARRHGLRPICPMNDALLVGPAIELNRLGRRSGAEVELHLMRCLHRAIG